jgi:cytochrome P450
LPVRHNKPAREAAAQLHDLIGQLVERRLWELDAGNAPDDLATRIMTTRDPDTEFAFSTEEMVDQVAIFFLARHESNAALLGWALWCLAAAPDRGERWPRKRRHSWSRRGSRGFRNLPSREMFYARRCGYIRPCR